MKQYCNPLNLEYKYQHYGKSAHREAADPTLIYFKGRYYLFASMSAGFYFSDDLIHWEHHNNRNLELYHYAPDVRACGDYMIFCASDRRKSSIWRTKDPFSNEYEKVSEPFPFWDPDTFVDDDGKVYFYWGCDNANPIFGVEMDRDSFLPIGEKKGLIYGKPSEHGFERKDYHGVQMPKQTLWEKLLFLEMKLSGRDMKQPFIEGAFMSKWNGKYYLQYAAPGTELSTYGDGVYISDHPLGPFTYQSHNPFSAKPGGFITGAGHGSTIEDEYGNLWHVSTMRISVNAGYERRVGLFPAGIDEDGILFCNQMFADWPMEIPDGKFDPMSIRPKYVLLSYKKKVRVSSFVNGHEPENCVDENIQTSWCAVDEKGQWIQLDLEQPQNVYFVQLNFSDVDVPVMHVNKEEKSDFQTNSRYIDSGDNLRTRWILEGSLDGTQWFCLKDNSTTEEDLSHDGVFFEKGVDVRYLKLTTVELPYHKKMSLSGFRVFGEPKGNLPEQVSRYDIESYDNTTKIVKWNKTKNTIGYQVRYGIAPDKLYLSHMVYEENKVILTMLNANQKYYFAVDSFGEGGITEGKVYEMEDAK